MNQIELIIHLYGFPNPNCFQSFDHPLIQILYKADIWSNFRV